MSKDFSEFVPDILDIMLGADCDHQIHAFL